MPQQARATVQAWHCVRVLSQGACFLGLFKIQLLRHHSPAAVACACADEIDAIGTKRYDSHSGGEREIQRTMLELLNQMDGFDALSEVKVRGSGLKQMGYCV